jgi:hypothetical protein
MNKYIITSPKFAGEINVLYGIDDKLLYIDFMKCELSDEQVKYFKEKLPVYYSDNFGGSFGTSNLTVIKEGFKVSFDQFWTRYNLKRHRIRAEKAWNKLSEADQVSAYFKLGQYERFLSLNSWRSKVEPERYLKDRFWESEWKNQ